jgi:hypothetical protein
MASNRILKLLRQRASAMIIASAAIFPALPAAADQLFGFCPANFRLWTTLCMNDATGDVVKPQTSGPAYEAFKAYVGGDQLCGVWDVHITTQIGDFGKMGTIPSEVLSKAGLQRNLARELCREQRYGEAMEVYEAIFSNAE